MAALDFGATSASTSSSASFLKRVGAGIWDVLVQMGHARARTAEMQYYMDMSDAELAEKGLRREDIVRHVFRGMLI
ncbi:hypothetical protein LY10_01577 [Planktotalea frisia]|jgi:hypothetical protein|uniref:DUF1127 domain-containing protein n=1 Tax=Planktotalea frisia TaxID=696762 RepID=A0A1L9NYJ1_9RHOB|nr:hypothetical protein [Planktotalea frisia]MDB9708137.1 DUF1127 domain-containing protein [Planktotalea frisia]OJI94355.1 hypothetical protein PFRI_13840 [Planktotalea frisia]PZX30106.1 hypothetical protein LY10_01577 [Planktotalea frisia]